MVYRIYVEKKEGLANDAAALRSELKTLLGIERIADVRIINRYDVENIDDNGVAFKATVFVKPEVKIEGYLGLEAEKDAVEVKDEEVDAEIKRVQERNSRKVNVDVRPAETGDTVEFDFEGFKELYHMRWNEENSFRDLKYPLCLTTFHSKKYEYIVQEVWARTILHNFSSAIASDVEIEKKDTLYGYQANFSEACKICRDFLRIHDGITEMDVESLIAQNIEPIRPGRTFARQHRFKLPISFCYRR